MQKKIPLQLSQEFQYTLQAMEEGENHLFITGRAGTGKSTLLRLFVNTSRKRIAVLAPTGIAALNVKGQTIHSFFGLPPKLLDPSEIKQRKNFRLYQNVDIIIIDEVSMVRADLMDNIDRFLQINRNNPESFGGVQMIFFGDLYQLPPVIASPVERNYLQQRYESPYFFSSNAVRALDDFQIIELRKVYRQTEMQFIRLLDNIRESFVDYDDLEELNSRFLEDEQDLEGYITLSARNATVNRINSEKLGEINAPAFQYTAKVTGDFASRLFPCPIQLYLKVGAQVMFVKNDPDKKFVNGTIGIIKALNDDEIKVEILDSSDQKKIIHVVPMEWEILKYKLDEKDSAKIKTSVAGTFNQFPLSLAWAITIHKSQGKTFDRVIIDIGAGAFAHGQTYVALSRCRTMDGIILKQKIKGSDIIVDPRIGTFLSSSL